MHDPAVFSFTCSELLLLLAMVARRHSRSLIPDEVEVAAVGFVVALPPAPAAGIALTSRLQRKRHALR